MEIKSLSEIPAYIEKIDNKIKEIESAEGVEKYETDAPSIFGTSISNMSDTNQLIKVKATVDGREKEFKAAAKSLGVKGAKFDIDGHTASEWTKAVKYRIHVITNEEELSKLKETKAILEKNLEEEDRKKKDVSDALNGIKLD